MNKLSFSITINAPVDKVYKTMLDDPTYRKWTKIFNEASEYQGSWKTGERMLFIGVDSQGNRCGMISRIRENTPNRLVSIAHLGFLKDDVEISRGEEVESWAGALENYYFNDLGFATELTVEMDSTESFESYFRATWPKALDKLKSLCE